MDPLRRETMLLLLVGALWAEPVPASEGGLVARGTLRPAEGESACVVHVGRSEVSPVACDEPAFAAARPLASAWPPDADVLLVVYVRDGKATAVTQAHKVHWSEVVVKIRPQATPGDFPSGLTEAERCVVRVLIDEAGIPFAAGAPTCRAHVAANAVAVAMRYRFYPARPEGKAVPVDFELTVNFRPVDAPLPIPPNTER